MGRKNFLSILFSHVKILENLSISQDISLHFILRGIIIQLERQIPRLPALVFFDCKWTTVASIATEAYNALQTSLGTQSFLPRSVVKTGAEYPVHWKTTFVHIAKLQV